MEKGKKMNENFYQKECFACGRIMKEDWRFCPVCKADNSMTKCRFCGKEINIGWNYCPFCKVDLKAAKAGKERFRRENEWLRQQLEE